MWAAVFSFYKNITVLDVRFKIVIAHGLPDTAVSEDRT